MAREKYAMVPICTKYDDDDNLHVRRILIEYKTCRKDRKFGYYGQKNFGGTRFIAADPYFSKKDASHKYTFEDDGYRLSYVSPDNENASEYPLNIMDKKILTKNFKLLSIQPVNFVLFTLNANAWVF